MARSDIHKAYAVGMLWLIFIMGMAWNYSATAMHNSRAQIIRDLEQRVEIAEYKAQNPELLSPPTI